MGLTGAHGMSLSYEQFRNAVSWLRQNSGLILPYGKYPGSYRGGSINVGETEAIWNAYQWNPPQYFVVEYPNPDPNASTKPTYEELLNAFYAYRFTFLSESVVDQARDFCEEIITIHAYGAHVKEYDRNASEAHDHEMHIRKRLEESIDPNDLVILKKMNDHRDHLRFRYHEIKHLVQSLEANKENVSFLEEIQSSIRNMELWEGATFTITGMTEPFFDHDNVPEYVHRVPENPPPFNMTIERERKDGSRHFFKVKTTAKAEVSLSTDQPGFVSGMPSQLTLKRAGSSAFESVISRFAPTLTIKASAAPYGETVESSKQIRSSNDHSYLAVPGYDGPSATIEWPDLSILITDAITQTRAYLRSLWLNDQGTVAMRLSSTTSQEDSWDAGPSFIASWLDNGSISLMNENGDELILTAPNAIGNTMQDSTEPYLWTVRNLTEVQAFITTFSTRPRQAAGIRFIV